MDQQQIDQLNQQMKPIVAKLNQIVAEELGTMPNYRYFQDKKKNMYFWTTQPILENGRKRFASGVYRYFKTKKQWILKKKVLHAKRHKAKDRAYKMYQKAMGAENGKM